MFMTLVEKIEGERRRLILTSGEIVELRLEDDSVAAYAQDNEIRRLCFRAYRMAVSKHHDETYYHLTSAFIEGGGGKYKYRGIGTEAFRFFREYTSAKVTFSENDGLRKDDGSHLTGDGVRFVTKLKGMMERGEI
jgi:hypothetical protein